MTRWVRLLLLLMVLALAAAGVDSVLRTFVGRKPATALPTTLPSTLRIIDHGDPALIFLHESFDKRSRALRPLTIRGLEALGSRNWWACENGNPTAFVGDISTGKTLWSAPEANSFPMNSLSTISSHSEMVGLIYVQNASRGIFAMDDKTFLPVWTSDVYVEQLLSAGALIFTAHGETLRALDGLTGQVRWSRTAPGSLRPGIALSPDGQTVILVAENLPSANLLAINAADGQQVWSRPLPFMHAGAPGVGGGRVVVGDIASSPWTTIITATDLKTGQALWESRLASAEIGVPPSAARNPGMSRLLSPAVDAAFVYQPIDNQILALDAANGSLRWQWRADEPVRRTPPPRFQNCISTPLIDQNRLIIATRDGASAIEATSGREIWRCIAARPFPAQPTVPLTPVRVGDAYLVATGNSIAALRVDDSPTARLGASASIAHSISSPAIWGTAGFLGFITIIGLLFHKWRAIVATLCFFCLAGMSLLWFDSYQAARFIGREQRSGASSVTAEHRNGIYSWDGSLVVGQTRRLWNNAICPPIMGDSSGPLCVVRLGLDDLRIMRTPSRFGWVNSSRPSGSDLGPQAIHGVVVPHWPLAAFFAIAPLAWLSGSWRDRKRYPKGHCLACGYDLRGLVGGGCPECGDGRD